MPKFASLQGILLEESDTETGVVSAEAEGRLEVEMRKSLIDFFERFFLWCALFQPVRGSRGMRKETVLTQFGKVDVVRRYVINNKERPGFIGRVGRCTRACEEYVAEEGCDRSSFKRAETVSRARGIDISASKIREVTLRHGKETYESPVPEKIDLMPKQACGGKRRRTALTMVASVDGTCAPCAKEDLKESKGRDGGEAKGRNIDVGMVAVYNSVRTRENAKCYVRYKEGAELYSIGLTKFQQLVKEAGAVIKVDKLVLVDCRRFEEFLESFRES